jgi:hypothetical protein
MSTEPNKVGLRRKCLVCGAVIVQGRGITRRYCSIRCKPKVHRRRKTSRAAPTTEHVASSVDATMRRESIEATVAYRRLLIEAGHLHRGEAA